MEQDKPKTPTYDYLPFFIGKKSTDEINNLTKNSPVTLLSYEESKQRYLGEGGLLASLPEDEFKKIYDSSLKSYNQYRSQHFNGFVADKWMYGDPDKLLIGSENVIEPKADFDGRVIGKPGFDINGVRVMSDQQIAEQRGEIVGLDGKIKKYESPGFFTGLLNLLPGIQRGIFNKPVTVLDYDKEGDAIFAEKNVSDPSIKGQQVIGAFGASEMDESWLSTALKSIYNGLVPTAVSTVGTAMEMSDNVYDFIFNGGENVHGLYEITGRTLQNEAASMKIKVSENASLEPFENVPSTINAIGEIAAQLFTVQLANLGAKAVFKAGSVAQSYITSFGAFGAISADAYFQAGKEMGIDPMSLTWQSYAAGIIEGATETILGPKFVTRGAQYVMDKAALKGIAKEKMADAFKDLGIKGGSRLTKEQSKHVVKKVTQGFANFYEKTLKNPTTGIGRMAMMANEEGMEEMVANPFQNALQTINDYLAIKNNPNAKPGEGMFSEYDTDKSLIENIAEQAPKGLWQGYVLGTLGGAIAGIPHFKAYAKQKTMEDFVIEGKDQQFYDAIDKMHAAKVLDKDHLDAEGNIIDASKEGRVLSLNDIAAQQAKKEYQYLAEVRDKHGIFNPATIKAIGDNLQWKKQALQNAVEMENKMAELKAIQMNPNQSEGDKRQAAILEKEIATARINLNNIILPEEGSDFSKAYNDAYKNEYLKDKAIDDAISISYSDKNVEKPQKNNPEYLSRYHVAHQSKLFDNMYDRLRATDIRIKEEERKKKEKISIDTPVNLQTGNKILKDLESFKFDIANDKKGVESITTGLREISKAITSSFGVPEVLEMKQRAVNAFQTAIDTMDTAIADQYDTLTEGLENITKEASDWYDDINLSLETAKSNLETLKTSEAIPEDINMMEDLFFGDIEKTVEEFKNKQANGYVETDVDQELFRLGQTEANIRENANALEIRGKYLKDQKVQKHLSKDDYVMPDEFYQKGIESLKTSSESLKGIKEDLNKLRQQKGAKNQQREVLESNMAKYSLVKIKDIFKDAAYAKLVDSIVEFDDAIKKSDTGLTPETINTLKQNRNKIKQAQKMLFDNRTTIFTNESVKTLLAVKEFKSDNVYTSAKDNPKSKDNPAREYNDDLMDVNGDLFTENNTGYVYLINFIVTSVGVDPYVARSARVRYLKSAIAEQDNLSSYEQMQSADHIVAVIVNDDGFVTKFGQYLLNAEKENKKKGYSQANIDVYHKDFIPNALFVRGEYRTGKTKQVIAEAFKILSNISDKTYKVSLVGISDMNIADLQESLKGIKNIELKPFLATQFFETGKQAEIIESDYIVWDEASLINQMEKSTISNVLKGRKTTLIMLGDDSQFKEYPEKSESQLIFAQELGLRTNPIVRKYASDVPLIDDVARSFKMDISADIEGKMPRVAFKEYPENGKVEKVGATYHNTIEDVIDDYKKSQSSSKALVVYTDDEKTIELLKSRGVDPNTDKNVFLLRLILSDKPGKMRSIQGQRRKEVYVAIDYSDGIRSTSQGDFYSNMMYTAVGRASNFVALKGKVDKNTTIDKVNWKEPNEINQAYIDHEAKTRIEARRSLVGELSSQSGYTDQPKEKSSQNVSNEATSQTTILQPGVKVTESDQSSSQEHSADSVKKSTKERYKNGSEHWRNGEVFTLNTTVGSSAETNGYSESDREESNMWLIANSDQNFFEKELVYSPKISYRTDKEGIKTISDVILYSITVKNGMEQEFKDFLSSRKDVPRMIRGLIVDTGKSLNQSSLQYVLQLASPQKGYRKDDGTYDFVTDFAKKTYTKQIKEGFADDKDQQELNLFLADLIFQGRKLGNQPGRVYQLPVKVILSPNGTGIFAETIKTGKLPIAKDIIEKYSKRGYQFSEMKFHTQNGKTHVVSYVAYGRTPDPSRGNEKYIILRKKKFSELDNVKRYLKETLKRDKENQASIWNYDAKPYGDDASGFTFAMNSSWMNGFATRNYKQIKDSQLKQLLDYYGTIDNNGRYRLNGKNDAERKKNYKELFETFIDKHGDYDISDLELPFVTKQDLKDNDGDEQIYSYTENISRPTIYLKFDKTQKIKPEPKKEEAAATEFNKILERPATQQDNAFTNAINSSFTEEDKVPFEVITPNTKLSFISLEEVESIFKKLVHSSVWDQVKKDGIVPNLQHNGVRLAGMMINGEIKLALFDKGIKETSPKHEIFHLVFNYMIDQQSRDIVLSDARRQMSELGYSGNLSDAQVEEWMARKFAKTEDIKPWYTFTGLWQRFLHLVDQIQAWWNSNTSDMEELFYQINNGRYQDTEVNVSDDNITIARHEEIEEQDDENEFSDDEYMQHYYNVIPTIFSRESEILHWKKTVGEKMNFFSNYQTKGLNEDLGTDVPLSEAYKQFEQVMIYSPEQIQQMGEYQTAYGKVKDLTKDQAWLLYENNYTDYRQYVEYHLHQEKTLRAFVKAIKPKFNFDDFRSGKYNQSTQYKNKNEFNPDQTKTDQQRWQLMITPYYEFDSEKKPVKKSGFVDVAELEHSLNYAANNLFKRMRTEKDLDPFYGFMEELRKIATKDIGSRKSNMIYSYIHRYFQSADDNTLALYQISKRLLSDKNEQRRNKGINITEFLIANLNFSMSLHQPTNAVFKIMGRGKGKTQKLEMLSKSSEENLKHKIIDNISNRIFYFGSAKQDIKDKLGFGDKSLQKIKVTSNGLYWTDGNKEESKHKPLIEVVDGKLVVTDHLKNAVMRKEIIKTLGLYRVVPMKVMSDMLANRGANITETLLKNTNTRAMNNQDFMTELIMNMFWSLHSNIKDTSRIFDLNDKLSAFVEDKKVSVRDYTKLKKIEGTQEIIDEIEQIKAKPTFHKEMESFRKFMGVTKKNIDGQLGPEDVTGLKLPKPTDYFKAFEALAVATLYQKGISAGRFIVSPEGKRIYNNKPHNGSSIIFDDGSKPFRENYQNLVKNKEIDPVAAEFNDGKRELYMMLTGEMELVSHASLKGIKTEYTGTDMPTEADLNNAYFHAFYNGLKESNPAYQKLYFGSTILGDKSEIVINEWLFNPNSSVPFVAFTTDNGKITDARMNDDYVNKAIALEFHRQKHAHEQSKMRWQKFAVESQVKLPEWLATGKMELDNDKFMFDARSFSMSFDFNNAADQKIFNKLLQILQRNRDYKISGDSINGFTVTLGISTLWDVPGYGDVYNIKNYKSLVDANGNIKITTRDRRRLFKQPFVDFTTKMRQLKFRMPEDVKQLMDGDAESFEVYYQKANNGEIKRINPIMEAFFFGYHIANNEFSSLNYGRVEDHGSVINKLKYSASHHTPGTLMNVYNPFGLAPKGKELAIQEMHIKDPNTGVVVRMADGETVELMLAEQYRWTSVGGQENGPIDKTMSKPITSGKDMATGMMHVRKESNEAFSGQLFLQNQIVRKLNRDMLMLTDREIKKQYPDYNIDLWVKFNEFWRKDEASYNDPTAAFRRLRDWIVVESGWNDVIRRNLVQHVRNTSTHKSAVDKVNIYDVESMDLPDDIVLRDIDNTQTRYVLNPHQELDDYNRLSPPMQGDSLYGLGPQNFQRGKDIHKLLFNQFIRNQKDLEKRIYGEAKSTDEKKNVKKLMDYLANKGVSIVKAMNNPENFAQLLKDDAISKELPQVMEILQRAYAKEVNRIIKSPMTGLRMNLSSGIFIQLYWKDGIPYTLSEVERMTGKVIEIGKIPEDFTVRTIQPMLKEEGLTRKAEVVAPYIYRKQFGLSKTDNINDVMTLWYADGTSENVRNLPVVDIIAKMTEKPVDINRTIFVREGTKWNGAANYINAFRKSLTVLASRVPLHRLGSGAIGEIVSFADDNGNTIYIHPAQTVYSDEDFDIDQKSVYFYSISQRADGTYYMDFENSKNGNDNQHLELIASTYLDPLNQPILFSKSTTEIYDKKASEIEKSNKSSAYKRDNDYASSLDMFNIAHQGDEAIGIIINSLTTFAYMAQTDPAKAEMLLKGLRHVSLESDDFSETSIIKMFEGGAQAILDNIKKFSVGTIGVTQDSINILAAMIVYKQNIDQIGAFYQHPTIRDLLMEMAIGNNLEVSKKDYDIFKLIRERKAKLTLTPVNDIVNVEKTKKQIQKIYDQAIKDEEAFTGTDHSKDPQRKRIEAAERFLENTDTNEYEKLVSLKDKIRETLRLEKAQDDMNVLNDLEKYAYLANAMFRISRILSIRSGADTMEWKRDSFYHEIQLYLGQPLESFVKGEKPTFENYWEFFKKNSTEYKEYGTSDTKLLEEKEKTIFNLLDLHGIIREYPDVVAYLGMFEKEIKDLESITWEHHPVFKTIENALMEQQRLGWFKYKDQYFTAKRLKQDFLMDYFFKAFYKDKGFDLSVPVKNSNGWVKTLSAYDSVRLDTRHRRHIFVQQFPVLHEIFHQISLMDETEGENVLITFGLTKQEAKEAYKAMYGNIFLENMGTDGREEAAYIKMLEYNMNADRIAQYSSAFSRLPKWMQDLYIFNQLINTGFGYKKGSIIDIFGKDIYKREQGLTAAIEMMKVHLDSLINNQEALDAEVQNYLFNMLTTKGITSYVSKDTLAAGYDPLAIVKYEFRGEHVYPQVYFRKNDGDYVAVHQKAPRGGYDSSTESISKYQYVAMSPENLETTIEGTSLVTMHYPNGHGYLRSFEGMNANGDVIVPHNVTYSTVSWRKKTVQPESIIDTLSRTTNKENPLQQVYNMLHDKLDSNTITDEEYKQYMDLMDKLSMGIIKLESPLKFSWARKSSNGYEVSSKGDSRFSAFNAILKKGTKLKDGKYELQRDWTIEEYYQVIIKGYNSIREGKGKPPRNNITKEQSYQEYKSLWKTWADQNPELIKELYGKAKGKALTDQFANTEINQARALSEILNELPIVDTEITFDNDSENVRNNNELNKKCQ